MIITRELDVDVLTAARQRILTFNGQAIGGTPQAPSDGFVQRGDVSYAYTITLELESFRQFRRSSP
jgi:hypothetical protein